MINIESVEGFRLSPQQKRLWFLQQDDAAYRAQCAILIEGPLDTVLLEAAVGRVINRHEILLTTFRHQPGLRTPVQVIGGSRSLSEQTHPSRLCSWRRENLSELDEMKQLVRSRELFEQQRKQNFDFEQGPLVRLWLLCLGTHKHLCFITLPALCADSLTLKYLYEELCSTYKALLRGEVFTVAAMQYADYAEWQNELAESEAANAGRDFWQERRSGLLPATIPFEHRQFAAGEFEPERLVRTYTSALAQQCEDLVRKHHTHVAIFLQACWQTLLWRLTQQSEIVVGRIFDGRNHDELKGAFGLMARCVPVSCCFKQNPSFDEVLMEAAGNAREADQWQECWTWNRLAQAIQSQAVAAELATRANYAPLSFEYQERCGSYVVGDLVFSIWDQFVCFDRYKLKLVGVSYDRDDKLCTEFHYDPQHIMPEAVSCLAGQFQQVIESVLDNPRALVSEIRLLSQEERRRLLVELNQTEQEYSRNKLIQQLFEEQAASVPDRVAVVYEGDQLSYGELNARANQLAHYLRARGVGPETPVLLNVERSLEMMIGLLGILKAGGAYVPLDGPQPRNRLAAILDEVSSPVVVTQASLKAYFADSERQLFCIDSDWEAISDRSVENPCRVANVENLVYVIYTSGSTGKPKGVAVEHRHLTNYFYAINQRIRTPRQGSYATVSTFAADLGNTMIYLALCNGGTLHIIPQQRATDGAALADYFSRREIDCLKIVPSHLEALLAHDRPEALLPRKCLLVGGEAAGHKLINRVRELAPQCDIYNHYGPTETTVGVLTSQAGEGGRAPAAAMLPIGRPLGNTEVYVLDQQMEPVATGETGEVYLGGAQVARGYINQPNLTAERFWPNPFGKRRGERVYRTGDLGRFSPDGAVEFMGRADSQVKLHGHRIELEEIRCVLNQHPQISDSVVVINKDNNAQDVMIAYYTGRESIAVDQLRTFMGEYLTRQVTPNFFIHLTKFPLTPNGKLDLLELSRIDRQGSPRAFIEPRTPMEEILAGLWAILLGVKQISTHDNFFTLGGHSLLATRIVSQLSKSLQMDVPIEVLFESPTIAEMADRLQAMVKAGKGLQTAPIVRVSRDRELPLSFAQERLWFMDQLEPGSSGYHSTSALRLTGPLDLVALQKTLDAIIQRHEVLRTTFKLFDGTPVQVVSSGCSIELSVVQLSDLPDAERDDEALRFANEDSVKPFDLAVGPLLRVTLLFLAHERHVLVVTMHHIISDAWSNSVLMREVSALYDAFIHNRPSPLAELAVQYADFAFWQRQLFQTDALEAQLAFWRARLANHLPMLEIPSDHPRPEVRTFRGGKHSLNFSRGLAEELRTLSRRNEVTLFMTTLAAFQILMRFLTKQDDIVIGTDVANRTRTETEGLIGFFINQLVLLTNLSGNPSFSELLVRVREVVLGAYAHQDLPFNKLVEALRPERSLTYSPFFQVKFGFETIPTTPLEMTGLTAMPLEFESIGAKLDFTILLHETRHGISGWVEYNRDLFEPQTVARIAEYFETLLGEIVSRPEARLGELDDLLAVLESRRIECERKERAEAQRKKFRSIKPQAITVAEEALVKTEYFAPGEKLPLILRPAHNNIELADWAGANPDLIESELGKHGAILFRDFDIGSSAAFERFAATLTPDLFNENGEHPRKSISGKVYTPVFYPSDQKLLWHNENSFNNRWPMKIWFYCVKPANQGGETILADSHKVFEAIDPRIRERFIQKKVMYVRNYQDGLGLDWQAVFQTTDKAEVERRCLQDGMEVQWKPGDRLCTRCVRPAAAKHPRTGSWIWFNQAQHWHISRVDAKTRRSLVSLFAEADLPRNCYYGDGTAIEDSVMDEICAVYFKLEVSFPWKAGDIMMLDNMLTAHGRNPFVGERKLCVAMGEMLKYDEV